MGATAPLHVGVAGIAKTNAPHPTVVANELVCNRLASALLLPTPPGFLIHHNDSPYYVSLNFNLAGHSLPPADPAAVAAVKPDLSWGIVLFDIWVLNDDRHPQNMSHDTTTNAVHIFDHSHALFAKNRDHLNNSANALGFGGECLAPRIGTLAGLDHWCARFAALPEFFIRTVVEDIAEPQFGVTSEDATFYANWLIDRRGRLKDLVLAHRTSFPGILPPVWNAAAAPPHAEPAGPASAPPAPPAVGAPPPGAAP
jgi:hypothetical protein